MPFLQFRDPGATRTPNQQNRNLSFYPLNYGTIISIKININTQVLQLFPKDFLFSQTK